jgi:hypothetical protein
VLVLVFLTLAPVAASQAQSHALHSSRSADAQSGWSALRISKWTLLGTAAIFGGYALSNSRRASNAYGALHRLCAKDASACTMTNGRYDDERAESFFQTTVHNDKRAQIAILGAHTALLGGAALFVLDLRHPNAPPNIPFPSSGAGTDAARAPRIGLGVSVAVR